MFGDERSAEDELREEVSKLKKQLQEERGEIAAILWVIFLLGFGYGFYADHSLYRFTHNVGDMMAPLVGIAAMAYLARAMGFSGLLGIMVGVVFVAAVYAFLILLF